MEGEQSQVQQASPQPMMMMGHTSEGALQFQLDCHSLIDNMEHVLRGEKIEVDETTGRAQWMKKYPAMINNDGVNMLTGYLNLYVGGTKNFALTSFTEDYVSEQVICVGNLLINNLSDNWTRYELKDYNTASFIVDFVCATIYAILKKGENANYLKFLRTTQQIQETQNYSNAGARSPAAQDDGGLLNSLLRRKRSR